MKHLMVTILCLFFLISMSRFVYADAEHQHESMVSEQAQVHQHDGMGTPSILTGGVTLLVLLFTFSLGFLGRRGVISFNLRLHSLGAYATVFIAIVHVIVNLLTH